jgi:protein gp37
MAENSAIEWTRHTFNPWRGCTKVSAGCAHCYAETLSGRNPKSLGIWGPRGTRVIAAESYWRQPLKWNAAAKAAGERHNVFCASLADVFEGPDTMPEACWPLVQDARRRLCGLIEQTRNLNWLLLTKRPQYVDRGISDATGRLCSSWLADCKHVWIGTSVEDQDAADKRIPELLKIPAKVLFLSCEPLLGPVDLNRSLGGTLWIGGQRGCNGKHRGVGTPDCPREPHHHHDDRCDRGINWVIVGGESGSKARAMHPEWAREIRYQCAEAGVPFLFKQHGEYAHETQIWNDPASPDDGVLNHAAEQAWLKLMDRDSFGFAHQFEDTSLAYPVGKHAAGRVLDGRTWDGMPAAPAEVGQ